MTPISPPRHNAMPQSSERRHPYGPRPFGLRASAPMATSLSHLPPPLLPHLGKRQQREVLGPSRPYESVTTIDEPTQAVGFDLIASGRIWLIGDIASRVASAHRFNAKVTERAHNPR